MDSGVGLIADTRERAVHPFLSTELAGNPRSKSQHLKVGVPHAISQIQVGDFIITEGGPDLSARVLAVVERKTHADFAASLTDRRHENKNKMIEMRRLTGCDVFYLMEGPAFPTKSTRFGRVPWSTIQAAAYSLSVRDRIFLLHSKNAQDTASVLNVLSRTYLKHKDSRAEWAEDRLVPEGGDGPDLASAMKDSVGPSLAEQGPKMQAIVAWSGVPGVTDATGAALVEQASVAALARGVLPYKEIRELKTPQGKRLANATRILKSVRLVVRSPKDLAKFISKIPGFSLNLSRQTFCEHSPELVCSLGPEGLAALRYGKGTVGKVRAARLWQVLHYVSPGGVGDLGPRPEPAPIMLRSNRVRLVSMDETQRTPPQTRFVLYAPPAKKPSPPRTRLVWSNVVAACYVGQCLCALKGAWRGGY
jgi:hypothetical protein